MKREFDLRKLDPLFEQGMEEALKEFKKQFPNDQVASLGVYFSHQVGMFEIMAHADANDLPEDCLEFEPGYVGGFEAGDIEGFDYESFYFGEED